MIKKLTVLIVSVLAIFLLAGCNEDKNSFLDVSSLSKEDYKEAFNEVVGANIVKNVLNNHERYKIIANYFDTDGSTVISADTCYISSDKIYREASDGGRLIFEKGEKYGYDAGQKMPYFVFFLKEDFYNDDFQNYFNELVYVSNQYNITDIKEEDDNILITGELSYEELCDIEGTAVSWIGEGEVYKAVFYINKDNLEANKIQYMIESADSSKLIAEIVYEYDIADFKASEELYNSTHGEGRTSNIIYNPNTKSEEKTSVKVPTKCDIVYYYDDSVKFYYDLEKTNIYTYDMHNTDTDETIYCFDVAANQALDESGENKGD